jgi:hypothetical protein
LRLLEARPFSEGGMADHIHTHSARVRGTGGTEYEARVYGLARSDGTWQGWLEFFPMDGGPVLRTGQETSQANRDAVEYWAGGLEPVYLDGALARAWP